MTSPDTACFVLKFGGSSATTSTGINHEFLREFLPQLKPVVDECFPAGQSALVIGGGPRARIAMQEAQSDTEKETLGMQVTWEHAIALLGLAREVGWSVHPTIPYNEAEAEKIISHMDASTLTLGGLEHGQTTDAVALTAAKFLARKHTLPKIVVTSDIDHIYTGDPRKNPQARPIARTSVQELLRQKIVVQDQREYRPGMNVPLDPRATRLLMNIPEAELLFTTLADPNSIIDYLAGRPVHTGTLISPNARFTLR